ncbi:TetR/AcrR family transcriptional regulator [Streptomyces aidingensis]|uniref:DNA-binding transcriptional regulator, AcrR family n=1 Tax=Streptomyces aidingensis TaxID=910347 RepID=A0A1I1JAD7_9ACTN|nr:TetR/AcrR family transcriptional regulator [Streptomyces aidingensis]SFC45569.1 DNA-binding transcriptional regulator, AcrR family [Streptomyces aidingensis]
MTERAAGSPLRPGGRTRLSPEREQELYAAVLELLRERGYDALTMDAVAARTRSSKATLYRQWKTKLQLVISALLHGKRVSLEGIDTGSLAGDLDEMIRRVSAEAQENVELLQGLLHAGQRDPGLLRAVRETLLEPETEVLRRVLRRAAGRGELDPDNPATEFLTHAFIGAMLTRPLVEGRHADAAFLTRFADALILPALRTGRPLASPAPALADADGGNRDGSGPGAGR